MSKLDHMLEPRTSVRRVEVITESGRRRQFSADDKAPFVEETLAPGAVVSEVARRHGLSPQQLFTWRRQMRQPVAIPVAPEPQTFVPGVVTPLLRVMVATRPVDFRKGAEGLAALVRESIQTDPFSAPCMCSAPSAPTG